MSDEEFTGVPEPTYEWVDKHAERSENLQRAHAKAGGLWGYVPGLVYIGAVVLLSAVLGTEISKLFSGQSTLLQTIGWGCVVVVGMSAIASYFGKGDVYKSERQQRLGKTFWVLELLALTIGLLVAIADAFKFSGLVLDIARFLGFMSVVVAAFGWGIVRWASPEWKVTSEQNKSDAALAIKMAELDAQYALSDEMIKMRMWAAYNKAHSNALAALHSAPLINPPQPGASKTAPKGAGVLEKFKTFIVPDKADPHSMATLAQDGATVVDATQVPQIDYDALARAIVAQQAAQNAVPVKDNGHAPKG